MSGPGLVRDAVVVVLGLNGAFFFLAGTLGMLRFPDFYSRAHAASKCDTLGAGSILIALAVLRGFQPDMPKLLLLVGLLLLTSPTAAHTLARAAYRTGLKPLLREGARG